MFVDRQKKIMAFIFVCIMSFSMSGCGGSTMKKSTGAQQVKVMPVLQQDAPISYQYAGQVKGKDEVKIQSRVSGVVVEKYIHGGDSVQAGQPLYKLDSRQYESAVLSAQAALAQSEATLSNARTDLARDQDLLASDAVSEQTVTTQQAAVQQDEAAYAANAALLRAAQQNLDDTVVYAPISGKIGVDHVASGSYAVAGSTVLVTIGSIDPVYVQFSISETEYLKFMEQASGGNLEASAVTITLADGRTYPLTGHLVQADRALSDNTGTLAIKALVANPDGTLLPGMFARVKLTGQTVPNALLVPQRAVQQLLDKSYVIVVGPDGTAQNRVVQLGNKIGSYYVIQDGISAGEQVVVEGLTNLQEGTALETTSVTPEEMGFSLEEDAAVSNTADAS